MLVVSLFGLTGCSKTMITTEEKENDLPPTMKAVIQVNDKEFEMKRGGYRWERNIGATTQVIQTDHASPYQMADYTKAITLKPKQNILIEMEENPQLTVFLWNENGRSKEIQLNNYQITVPTSKGRYIYEVEAKWPNGQISYTFVVEI